VRLHPQKCRRSAADAFAAAGDDRTKPLQTEIHSPLLSVLSASKAFAIEAPSVYFGSTLLRPDRPACRECLGAFRRVRDAPIRRRTSRQEDAIQLMRLPCDE